MPHLKQHFHSKTPQCDALSDGDVEIEPYKSLQLGGLLNGDLQQKTFVPTLGLEMIFGNDSKDYLQIASGLLIAIASFTWWKRIFGHPPKKDPPPPPCNSLYRFLSIIVDFLFD
jgi:hypothetical protein